MTCATCDGIGAQSGSHTLAVIPCPECKGTATTRSTEVPTEPAATLPAVNHVYVIHWEARDLGYGVEDGFGEYVYRGQYDAWGKHEWQSLDGSPTLYLFTDEILSIGEES